MHVTAVVTGMVKVLLGALIADAQEAATVALQAQPVLIVAEMAPVRVKKMFSTVRLTAQNV